MAKYICDDFNALCTELGLQCLIVMDPETFNLVFEFHSFSQRPIILFTDDFSKIIEARETVKFPMKNEDSPWMAYFE